MNIQKKSAITPTPMFVMAKEIRDVTFPQPTDMSADIDLSVALSGRAWVSRGVFAKPRVGKKV